jgi:hypothetical protein
MLAADQRSGLGDGVTLQNELVELGGLLGDPVRRSLFVLCAGRSCRLLDKLPDVVSENRNAIVELRK